MTIIVILFRFLVFILVRIILTNINNKFPSDWRYQNPSFHTIQGKLCLPFWKWNVFFFGNLFVLDDKESQFELK